MTSPKHIVFCVESNGERSRASSLGRKLGSTTNTNINISSINQNSLPINVVSSTTTTSKLTPWTKIKVFTSKLIPSRSSNVTNTLPTMSLNTEAQPKSHKKKTSLLEKFRLLSGSSNVPPPIERSNRATYDDLLQSIYILDSSSDTSDLGI